MERMYHYDKDDYSHFCEYHVGPDFNHIPTERSVYNHQPPKQPSVRKQFHEKVGITGKMILRVKYINKYGHIDTFEIEDGTTYVIEAVSQTKGVCRFAGKIVDFETSKGTERILEPPHEVDICAIIIDYSNDYQSKLIRIGIDNIIMIKPIESLVQVSPDEMAVEDYVISNPFSDKNKYVEDL